jgi:hypothetical protein
MVDAAEALKSDRGKGLLSASVLGIVAWSVVAFFPSHVTEIETAISLATAVVGFAMLVVGAFVGTQQTRATEGATWISVAPANLTAAVGALLLVVSRFA